MNVRSAIIEWSGETLELLPERAVWWAREETLFIADPHFGKAATFRFAGIPVPETSHDDDLLRLDRLLEKTAAKRFVILGDFLHAKTGRSASTLEALAEWRARNSSLEIVLVLGNHDRQAGTPPGGWHIESVIGPWQVGPFQCCHEPQEIDGSCVLAGHLHPSFRWTERIGSGLRGPCFYFTKRTAILPAFGSFTGNHNVKPSRGERVFLIGPDSVIEATRAVRRA